MTNAAGGGESPRGIAYLGALVAALAASRGRRVWRVIGPAVRTVSAVGWIVLGLGAASLVISAVLGWREFFYLGATLVAAPVIAGLFLFGRATYSVEIGLEPPRVVVGEKAVGSLTIENNGARPVPLTRMELPVGTGLAEFTVPALAPGETHEGLFTVATNKRAVILAGPARSVRGDQLGLLRRVVSWAKPKELFVHPVTTKIASSAAGLIHDLEGQASKSITDSDISFHALRPYVAGDDRRNIHWRSSARLDTIMVRQFEQTRRSQLTVLQPCSRDFYASDDEFELAVSSLASIATQVVRDGTNVSIVTEDRMLRTHTPVAVLDDCCRLAPLPKLFDSARLFARSRTLRLPPPSVVMIVTGSRMTTADFRAIASLFASDVKVVAVRAELGAASSLTGLTGVTVMTVGQLGDLPKLFKRAVA